MLLSWSGDAAANQLSTFDKILYPAVTASFIYMLMLTWKGGNLEIIEYSLFTIAVIALLGNFAEAVRIEPMDFESLGGLFYWFPFVYVLGFLAFNAPLDAIALAVFVLITAGIGISHYWPHPARGIDIEEFRFFLRFLLSQIGMYIVMYSVFRFNEGTLRLKAEGEAWEKLALTDSLTQVHNRMALSAEIDRELAQVHRHQRKSSILMMDVNRFKNINDKYGHQMGDQVLIAMAQGISKVLREGDYLARFGGDEFVVILPETDQREARKVVARIEEHITQMKVGNLSGLSISIGTYELEKSQSRQDVFKQVDERLYRAKKRLSTTTR